MNANPTSALRSSAIAVLLFGCAAPTTVPPDTDTPDDPDTAVDTTDSGDTHDSGDTEPVEPHAPCVHPDVTTLAAVADLGVSDVVFDDACFAYLSTVLTYDEVQLVHRSGQEVATFATWASITDLPALALDPDDGAIWVAGVTANENAPMVGRVVDGAIEKVADGVYTAGTSWSGVYLNRNAQSIVSDGTCVWAPNFAGDGTVVCVHEDGSQATLVTLPGRVESVALSPEGALYASSGGTIWALDSAGAATEGWTFGGVVLDFVFAPGGALYVETTEDVVWRVDDAGSTLFASVQYDGKLSITPDGWLVRLMPYWSGGTADIASLWEEWPLPEGDAAERVGNLPATSSPTLLAPEDGDIWPVGGVRSANWSYTAPDTGGERWPVVTVEASADDGRTWTTLDAAVLSPYGESVSASVTVPGAEGDTLLVRVRDYDEAEGATASVTVGPPEHTYTWTQVTGAAAFAARDGAGALTFDGKMWLLGGWNPSDDVNFPETCNSEVWSSTDGATWTEVVAEAPWEGRHTAGYAVFGERMWILGGDPIQGYYQPDAWSSADGVTWSLETDALPWGDRVLHHTVVLGDTIYVMGGQTLPQFTTVDEETVLYNDVWASTDGVSWTRLLEEAPWSPRGMIGGSAVLDGRMWLLGGGTYDTPDHPDRDYYAEVWSSADGVDWTRHTDAPWTPRQYHDVAVFDGKLWVLEGYNGSSGNRSDVWYSADGESWTELPDTPWPARHASSIFVHDDALWVVAGNNMTPDVWKLTVE